MRRQTYRIRPDGALVIETISPMMEGEHHALTTVFPEHVEELRATLDRGANSCSA